ncbi:MAG: FixH family protein [Acidobacteria bacterium]|nr:FixH family protein [Acidobacteriota bacterium]
MKKLLIAISVAALLALAIACAPQSGDTTGGSAKQDTGKVIKSAQVNSLTVTLSSPSGQLKHGGDEFFLSFTDQAGKSVDVGAVALNFYMPGMGTMPVMNNPTTFTTTNTPGTYRGKANIEMAGEWQAQITFEGSAGTGKTSIPVNVR